MAEDTEEGTGRHSHKRTEEPYPHHERKLQQGREAQDATSGGTQQSRSSRGDESESEASDLKCREYRDAHGNVHHHTHTYEEQDANQ